MTSKNVTFEHTITDVEIDAVKAENIEHFNVTIELAHNNTPRFSSITELHRNHSRLVQYREMALEEMALNEKYQPIDQMEVNLIFKHTANTIDMAKYETVAVDRKPLATLTNIGSILKKAIAKYVEDNQLHQYQSSAYEKAEHEVWVKYNEIAAKHAKNIDFFSDRLYEEYNAMTSIKSKPENELKAKYSNN